MRLLPVCGLGLIVLASTAGCLFGQQIPALQGKTLSGAPVDLPAQLQGKVGVLVLGFGQGARDQSKAWGVKLAAEYFSSPTVLYYEVPMLAEVPRFLRGMVLGKIADSVSERGKTHFLPIEDHEKEWKTLAGFHGTDDPYVLVLDGSGNVRWRFAGAETEASYAEMKGHVQSLLAGREKR